MTDFLTGFFLWGNDRFFDRINASLFSFGKMVSATLQRNRIYRIALLGRILLCFSLAKTQRRRVFWAGFSLSIPSILTTTH